MASSSTTQIDSEDPHAGFIATPFDIQQWEDAAKTAIENDNNRRPDDPVYIGSPHSPPQCASATLRENHLQLVRQTRGSYREIYVTGAGGRTWIIYHSTNGIVFISLRGIYNEVTCYLSPPTNSLRIHHIDGTFSEVCWLTGHPFSNEKEP